MDPVEILRWIVEHITLLLIPLLIWQTKTLLQESQTVYGTKGDNGLNGSAAGALMAATPRRRRLEPA